MSIAGPEAARFILNSFPSVWSLEVLLHLVRSGAPMPRHKIVEALRASDAIIANSVESFLIAGLIIEDEDGVRYQPASPDLALHVRETERIYRERPDSVRRLIVRRSAGGLTAFSDAFNLRGE